MTNLQTQTLAKVKARVPGFDGLPKGEKVLQIMAYLADVVQVREELGNNHGKFVDDFLKEAGGLGPGYPWCAAAINWCCEMVGAPNPDKSDAAVIGWKNWAKANNRINSEPKRGRLCFLITPGKSTGHIGIVKGFDDGVVFSIEANTSSGNAGSQRDGDGLWRRTRKETHWDGYISLE